MRPPSAAAPIRTPAPSVHSCKLLRLLEFNCLCLAFAIAQVHTSVHQESLERLQDFLLQQTMLRIKDPKKSLDFYTRVLGLTLLQKLDFPSMKFSLYFLAYEDKNDIPKDKSERTAWTFSRKATLELTHNWGTEDDETQSYHNGNSDPRGFGHIGIAVPDVYSACKRFEELGVKFVKKPDDGKMKGLAFIQDPDGYWIEILNPNKIATII